MNFDDLLDIFKEYNALSTTASVPKAKGSTDTPESGNKDTNAPEPAQTPNNTAGQKTKAPGAMERFKDEGGYGKLADDANKASAAGEGIGNDSMDRAQQGSANRKKVRADKLASRAAPVQAQKSFNPALASLLAVAAGFASSDAFVSGAGGRTNKDITSGQLAAFKRAGRRQTKARQQTKKNRSVTSKVKDIRMAYKEVAKQDVELLKAHAPVPPVQGLVWDQSVRKWRKPENVGKTASEVQGKKRIRGSGIGQTGKTAGGEGSGKGRGREFSHGRKNRVAEGGLGVAGKSRRISAKKSRRVGRKKRKK